MNKKDKKIKKNETVISYDSTGIGICGEFFDVNQDLPNTELLNQILKYQNVQKELDTQIKNYTAMIEVITKKQSEIITDNADDLIEKFNEFEKQKDDYKNKMSSIYTDNLEAVLALLKWLLGEEAIKLIKSKNIAFNEIVNILYEAMNRNNYIKNKLNA